MGEIETNVSRLKHFKLIEFKNFNSRIRLFSEIITSIMMQYNKATFCYSLDYFNCSNYDERAMREQTSEHLLCNIFNNLFYSIDNNLSLLGFLKTKALMLFTLN